MKLQYSFRPYQGINKFNKSKFHVARAMPNFDLFPSPNGDQ